MILKILYTRKYKIKKHPPPSKKNILYHFNPKIIVTL